ncbi:Hydroxyisourate hydrolase [Forsythia ovata]|uniref:Hydroxyisourate hydrolase n=1 Tax=Forsythia ovata TaxID=205694 RepID=A0ABD1W482_9LAMI
MSPGKKKGARVIGEESRRYMRKVGSGNGSSHGYRCNGLGSERRWKPFGEIHLKHDRCVLELRKKEQRNKRRRERNAEARREQQIQFQHHAGSSHVAAAEKRLLRNRQRREVTTKKKELRKQEYAHFEGGVSLQNKRSKSLVQLACYDTIVDECTVENELSAGCEGVLHDRGSAEREPSVVLGEKDYLAHCESVTFAEEMVLAHPFSDYQEAANAARDIWFNKVDMNG